MKNIDSKSDAGCQIESELIHFRRCFGPSSQRLGLEGPFKVSNKSVDAFDLRPIPSDGEQDPQAFDVKPKSG